MFVKNRIGDWDKKKPGSFLPGDTMFFVYRMIG